MHRLHCTCARHASKHPAGRLHLSAGGGWRLPPPFLPTLCSAWHCAASMQVMREMDVDGSGSVDYHEFIAATIHQGLLLQVDGCLAGGARFLSGPCTAAINSEIAWPWPPLPILLSPVPSNLASAGGARLTLCGLYCTCRRRF